jgi:2,4-dienoyl-CoA reductase-like NADH-dependent reductase (Old Yellow Enzyme family)/thioredoxin reductase
MTQCAFPRLFSPIRIGSLKSANRLLMPAMSINFGVDDRGRATDQLTAYFRARAQGGVGMMLVGGGAVHPGGLELPHLPALWEDSAIAPLERMVREIRPYGALFGVQLMHGGRQSYHDQKVAPSPIPAPAVVKGIPHELTMEEIQELVEAFGKSALRCRQAGFDFVEIHGAHGYLINQFLSPNANHRRDAYGGSFENRTRFYLQVLNAIKAQCGRDFVVGARINADDYIEGGWTLDDALRLVPLLEAAGADYLHVSAGVYGSRQLTIPSMYVEQGCFVHLAEAVKSIANVPVVAVGRIKDPRLAESIIERGQADMVAMGRSLLADAELPRKARENQLDRIRPCIGCCLGCIHAVLQLEPGGCVVNPDVGREYLLADGYCGSAPKKVLVVGAGPAGLAAARMAALCGHKPMIIDHQQQPGGLLRLAAMPPGRSDLQEIIDFFVHELQRLEVSLQLAVPLDADLLNEIAPDAAIVASGSLPKMPIIKGLFKTPINLCTVVEVLQGDAAVQTKALVLGGGQAGLVLTDHLAEQGKAVVVLHRGAHFAQEMSANDRYYLRERLKRPSVRLYKKVSIQSINQNSVRFKHPGGLEEIAGFDTVVVAEGSEPMRETLPLLKSIHLPIHIIGDAKSARHLMFAISEGEEAARAL